jgi:hypothetical protein
LQHEFNHVHRSIRQFRWNAYADESSLLLKIYFLTGGK